jgi:hypothetical protein
LDINNCGDAIKAKDNPIDDQDKDDINVDNPPSPTIINIQDKSNDKETDDILNNNPNSLDIY